MGSERRCVAEWLMYVLKNASETMGTVRKVCRRRTSARRQQCDTDETDGKQKNDCPYAWQCMGPKADVHAGGFPGPAPEEAKQEGMQRAVRPYARLQDQPQSVHRVCYLYNSAATRTRSGR